MATPTEIKLHQQSRVTENAFDDGRSFRLGNEQEARWVRYVKQLEAAGASR